MTQGIPFLVVLEDNDEDYQTVLMAAKQFGRPMRLERFRRAEDLIQRISTGELLHASLFLLDLRMPGGGGFLALDMLKKDAGHRAKPCVVLTTSNNPQEVQRAFQHHANAFHIKPLETAEMINLLLQIFRYWFEACLLTAKHRGEADE